MQNKFIKKPSIDKKILAWYFFVDLLERELQALACQNFIIFSVGGGGGALDTLQQYLL